MSRRVRPTPGAIVGWLLAGLVALAFVAIPDPREYAREHGAMQRLSIATGGTGGVWYPYGGGIAAVISRYVPNVEATAEVTAASVDNLKLLAMGSVDIAFSIADMLSDADRQSGAFADFGRVPARTLSVLYDQPVQLVTLQGTGIRGVKDLRGKVVSVGAPGSGTEVLARRVLEAGGIDPDRGVRPQSLSLVESVNALRDGKIDAFFWNSGLPAGGVLDLASTPGVKMRMLPTADVLPAMRAKYGEVYYQSVIPKETYPGMTEDVPVVSVASLLVADEKMSEDLAYEITRTLFEHQEELARIHSAARDLKPETAVRGSPVSFHPGAIRYYRERGVWP